MTAKQIFKAELRKAQLEATGMKIAYVDGDRIVACADIQKPDGSGEGGEVESPLPEVTDPRRENKEPEPAEPDFGDDDRAIQI